MSFSPVKINCDTFNFFARSYASVYIFKIERYDAMESEFLYDKSLGVKSFIKSKPFGEPSLFLDALVKKRYPFLNGPIWYFELNSSKGFIKIAALKRSGFS